MKIGLRWPRALNSGWHPTNQPHLNEHFNCRSDLGTIGVHAANDFPESNFELMAGQSYSIVVDPFITKSDKNMRSIDPKM